MQYYHKQHAFTKVMYSQTNKYRNLILELGNKVGDRFILHDGIYTPSLYVDW